MEMKEAVHNVEAQFVVEGGVKLSGLALRSLDADDDLAVLEGDYVSRFRFVHEPLMNFRNLFVGNQHHLNFSESGKPARFPSRLIQAIRQRALGKIAELRDINAHRSLAVGAANVWRHLSGRVSAWKFLVTRRAPLLQVTQ